MVDREGSGGGDDWGRSATMWADIVRAGGEGKHEGVAGYLLRSDPV
jgi:hypothetical protein